MTQYILYLFVTLPIAVALFWSIIIICKRGELLRSQKIGSFCLFTFALAYIFYALFFIENEINTVTADILYTLCASSIMPIYYLYTIELTSRQGLKGIDYLIFAPNILLTLIITFLYLMMGEMQSKDFIDVAIYHQFTKTNPSLLFQLQKIISLYIFEYFVLFQSLVICIISWNKIRGYHSLLKNIYSDVSNKSIMGNKMIYLFTIVFLLDIILLITHSRADYQDNILFMSIIGGTTVITIFIIGYYIWHQKYSAQMLRVLLRKSQIADFDSTDYQYNVSSDYNSDDLRLRINAAIRRSNLQSDFTLFDLADHLAVRPADLLYFFNQDYHTTLSDYVNQEQHPA